MRRFFYPLFLLLMVSSLMVQGQRLERINRYSFGMEVAAGHSFPGIRGESEEWQAQYFPAGSFSLQFMGRLDQKWMLDLGLGASAYALSLKGPDDHYQLEFASPHLTLGVAYSTKIRNNRESFAKLTSGVQMAFQDDFVDRFETYQVSVSGQDQYYYFFRPELGIRQFINRRMPNSIFNLAFELGVFYRHNLNALGSALIEGDEYRLLIRPNGHVIGGFFKFVIPYGRKRIRPSMERMEPLERKPAVPSTLRYGTYDATVR